MPTSPDGWVEVNQISLLWLYPQPTRPDAQPCIIFLCAFFCSAKSAVTCPQLENYAAVNFRCDGVSGCRGKRLDHSNIALKKFNFTPKGECPGADKEDF